MPLKFISISTKHVERDPNVIGQYECGSKNSVVEMRALKIKKIEDKHAVLTTNNCKQCSCYAKSWSKCDRNVSDTWRTTTFHAIYRALEW